MQVNFRFLQGALAQYNPETRGSSRTFFVTGYRVVRQARQLEETGTELVILPAAVWNQAGGLSAAGCICICRPGEDRPEENGGRMPMLLLTSEEPLDVMEERIQEALFLPYRYDQLKESLLDALAGGEGLDQILHQASRALGNPFTVFDNNFALLAHSIPDEMEIPEARQVVEHRSANLSVLMELRDTGELGQIQNDAAHPRLTNLPNGYQKMTCVLSVSHRHIGLLCFYNYQRPFRPGDEEIVEYVGKIVCSYLQRRSWNHTDVWNPYEYFVDQLLHNTYDEVSVEQFRQRLGLNFPPEMAALLVSASWYERQRKNAPLAMIAQTLRKLFPGSCVCVLEDSVLCLCAAKKCDRGNEPELWTQVKEFLAENRLFMGISDKFSNLSTLQEYYSQADRAMTIGAAHAPGEGIYPYRSYMLYHMISALAAHSDVMRFCHPALATLRAYDKEYKTEYLECLRVYLECNGSIADCAQRYYMHYNSIKYRLKVIQSVCGVDLNDPNTFVQLYLSFKITEVLEKLEDSEQMNPLNLELLDSLEG